MADDDAQNGMPVCMPDPDELVDLQEWALSVLPKWTEEPVIEGLYVFPIKACRGVKVFTSGTCVRPAACGGGMPRE